MGRFEAPKRLMPTSGDAFSSQFERPGELAAIQDCGLTAAVGADRDEWLQGEASSTGGVTVGHPPEIKGGDVLSSVGKQRRGNASDRPQPISVFQRLVWLRTRLFQGHHTGWQAPLLALDRMSATRSASLFAAVARGGRAGRISEMGALVVGHDHHGGRIGSPCRRVVVVVGVVVSALCSSATRR